MKKKIKEINSLVLTTFRKIRKFSYKILNKPRIYYDDNSYLTVYGYKYLNKYLEKLKLYKKQTLTNFDILERLKNKVKS